MYDQVPNLRVLHSMKKAPQFSCEEIDLLRLFQRRMDRFRALRIWRSPPEKFTVRAALGSAAPATGPFEGYDDDDLRACLTVLRQFWMRGEDVRFENVVGCLMKRKSEIRDDVVDWLRHSARAWRRTLKFARPRLTVGSRTYSVDHALDLLLNGEIMHADRTKAKIYNDISDLSRGTILVFVHRAMAPLAHCLCNLDTLVHVTLDDPDLALPSPSDRKA